MSHTLEEEVKEHGLTLAKVEERAKSNTKRLDEIDNYIKDNNKMISAINGLAIETKYMREDLNKTILRLEKLEDRDSEKVGKESDKWEQFKWLVLGITVTILATYLFKQIGIK